MREKRQDKSPTHRKERRIIRKDPVFHFGEHRKDIFRKISDVEKNQSMIILYYIMDSEENAKSWHFNVRLRNSFTSFRLIKMKKKNAKLPAFKVVTSLL